MSAINQDKSFTSRSDPPSVLRPAGHGGPAVDTDAIVRSLASEVAAPFCMPKWKRAMDFLGASAGLLLLTPVLLVVAIVIKLLSRGPVLFKHKRYGLEGEPFYVWKFRTMQQSVDPAEHRQHLTELMSGQQSLKKLPSRRLIPLGGWLRSSAIDELPQLVNILRGEMSLVGPRPDVVPLHEYEPWQRVRFRVLPGMTGLWQVSGKNNTTFDEMVRLDARYVEKCSLLFDLRIILLTLPAILAIILEELTSIQE